MLDCESKGSGHRRERTYAHPHFLFTFSLCYCSTEKPQLLQKEKLPVSFWKFSAELLLKTGVQQWLQDAVIDERKTYFLAKRNKFKQIRTQQYCLKWVLLHVRQREGWDLQLKTKSPTDEAVVCVLQLPYHWPYILSVLMNASNARIPNTRGHWHACEQCLQIVR